jgi:hypothetical protein
MPRKTIPLCLAFTMSMLLLCLPALAVLEKVPIVSGGEPVKNTRITITDEQGNKTEQDTDDKGILLLEGEKGEKYTLAWPGGEKTVTIPRFSKTQKYTAAGIVAAGTAIALAGGGGSGSSSSGHGSSTGVPSLSEIPGTYTLSGDLNHTGIPVTVSGDTIIIQSTSAMSGVMDPATGAYTGQGTFDGSNTETFTAHWEKLSNGTIRAVGILTFVINGVITNYNVTYTKNQ